MVIDMNESKLATLEQIRKFRQARPTSPSPVHQGDQNGVKGVYHINAVDIVTQWEPVAVRGFHSDSGS
jgi:hypothetical protein